MNEESLSEMSHMGNYWLEPEGVDNYVFLYRQKKLDINNKSAQ